MIFFDTHVLLWMDQRVPRMGAKARSVADDALSEDELWVSAISFCEIAALVTADERILGWPGPLRRLDARA